MRPAGRLIIHLGRQAGCEPGRSRHGSDRERRRARHRKECAVCQGSWVASIDRKKGTDICDEHTPMTGLLLFNPGADATLIRCSEVFSLISHSPSECLLPPAPTQSAPAVWVRRVRRPQPPPSWRHRWPWRPWPTCCGPRPSFLGRALGLLAFVAFLILSCAALDDR